MDKIQLELDSLERMTREYKKYLKSYRQGGDWGMYKFMDKLNRTTHKIKGLVQTNET